MTDNEARTPPGVKRDRWDRPLIIPPKGGDPVAYTRVSKLAKTLDDQNFLMLWKQRKTLEGVLRRPDLLTRAAGVLAKGDPDISSATKKALNAICGEATGAAGANKGSSAGTGFHNLTEAIDSGNEPLFVPEADKARLTAYRYATRDLEVLDIETFIVNDAVRCSGTFDRLVRCPDGKVRVADLKSGKSEAEYPLATTVQIAIYANGLRYAIEDGEPIRTPLHPDLDLTTGLLIHMPPSGGCEVIPLNLELGWEAAQLAEAVHHRVRKWKPKDLIRPASFFDSDATLTQGESEEAS